MNFKYFYWSWNARVCVKGVDLAPSVFLKRKSYNQTVKHYVSLTFFKCKSLKSVVEFLTIVEKCNFASEKMN